MVTTTKYLLENISVNGPDFAVGQCPDGGRALAVVQDGEFAEGLADAQLAQHLLAVLDHLELALGRDVEVAAGVSLANHICTSCNLKKTHNFYHIRRSFFK